MERIEIRNLRDNPVELWNPEDQNVGTIDNILDFYDVRVQIKNLKLSGYYFAFDGETIKIDENGECERYPEGFFDMFTGIAINLIQQKYKNTLLMITCT